MRLLREWACTAETKKRVLMKRGINGACPVSADFFVRALQA
jgi:hypothetical protein